MIISLLEKDLKILSVFFEVTVIILSVAVWGSLPHQHFPTDIYRKKFSFNVSFKQSVSCFMAIQRIFKQSVSKTDLGYCFEENIVHR